MAQEKNVKIPEQISWTQNKKEQSYRGTMVSSKLDNDGLHFGAQKYGKNVAHSDAFSIPSDITGGAIDISFNGSSYPSIESESIGNTRIKQGEPLIEVVNDEDIEIENNVPENAPFYDGFQPHYAHHSNTMNPIKMQQTLKCILSGLEQNGWIDFYAKSPFVFAGRAFGSYNDCEFLLSIFCDPHNSSQCIVEIRRSSGESFEYANIENNLLRQLTVNGAIFKSNSTNKPNDTDTDTDNDDDEEPFGFGFASLPSLDSMDLDSNLSSTDIDDDDDHKHSYFEENEMDLNKATKLLHDAVDLESMRDVLRSDIAHLNEQMAKNEHIFKEIPDIIATIVGAINDEFYDCWGIKMYLGMISKLLSISAPIPSSLFSSIDDIKTKWCHIVVNHVAPGVNFEFYPSQQIVRCCDQIIDQLNHPKSLE